MRTTVYLVRHAEAETNVDPLFKGEIDGLTTSGLEDGKALGSYFKAFRVADVYTSDVLRAKLTATEIGGAIGKEPIVLDFLKERKVTYTNTSEYTHDEPFSDMRSRILEAKHFLENLPQGHFVLVSHAIFLKALLSFLLLGDMTTEEQSKNISDVLILENSSITKCMYNKDKSKWRMESLNQQM